MNALESDHRAGGGNLEVKVVANGHCHSKSRPFLHFCMLAQLRQSRRIVAALEAFGFVLVVGGMYLSAMLCISTNQISTCCRSYSGYGKVG
jgi:hypothetical protein